MEEFQFQARRIAEWKRKVLFQIKFFSNFEISSREIRRKHGVAITLEIISKRRNKILFEIIRSFRPQIYQNLIMTIGQ